MKKEFKGKEMLQMAANVETMFSVREKPWHGLGTIVMDAPTSSDALRLAGLDWNVVQEPVYTDGHELVRGYKANIRSSDRKMALGVSTGAANILFNYIFMVPLQMGIKGATLGTGIGYLIPTVAGILFFTVGNGGQYFRKPVIDISILAGSCANGFSEMVRQGACAVTTFLFNRIMRLRGKGS